MAWERPLEDPDRRVRMVADARFFDPGRFGIYGETHLLVPTGPGVREPQNRRVEIVLE